MNDKLEAMINRIADSQSKKAAEETDESDEHIPPPTSVEEFIKAEKLSEWPFRLTSENPLELDDERRKYGNREKIYKALEGAASTVDLSLLNKLEDRLDSFYDRLLKYADMLFIRDGTHEEESRPITSAGISHDGDTDRSELATPSIKSARSPEMKNKAFMTDFPETDLQMVHPSKKARKKLGIKESLVETKKKGVENCVFPGFHDGELTELPGNIEAPQILNKVTRAASFNSGFKKYWKKIFQSEASVAIMQDAFWWIFLEYFQQEYEHDRCYSPEMKIYLRSDKHKRKRVAQDQLFDRIADSFVALFVSVHPEVKDKFFKVYSDCLAQSIFVAFSEAFPESDQSFEQEDFKQLLTSTISEWVTGVRAPPGTWRNWPLEKLDLTPHHAPEEAQNGSKIDVTAMARGLSFHLDMDGFAKTMSKLEEQPPTVELLAPTGVTFQLHKATSTPSNVCPAHSATKQVPGPSVESHPIGKGPEVERVRFNLSGQSPLIAHYQRMHQMKHIPSLDRHIKRTEVTKPPPNTQTYRDLIEETKANSKAMHQEYERMTETADEEIAKIEKQQRDLVRAIENLKIELKATKNVPEIKMKSELLFERGASFVATNAAPVRKSVNKGQASNSHSSDSVPQ